MVLGRGRHGEGSGEKNGSQGEAARGKKGSGQEAAKEDALGRTQVPAMTLNPAADADVAVGMAGGGGEEVDVAHADLFLAFLQCLHKKKRPDRATTRGCCCSRSSTSTPTSSRRPCPQADLAGKVGGLQRIPKPLPSVPLPPVVPRSCFPTVATIGCHCKELPVPKGWDSWLPTSEPEVTIARNCWFPKVGAHGCQPGNHWLPLQGTAGSQTLELMVAILRTRGRTRVTIARNCRFPKGWNSWFPT